MKVFRKVLLVLFIILLAVGCGVLGYLYYNEHQKSAVLAEKSAEVQGQLEAMGPMTQCWTVSTEYKVGTTLKDDTYFQQMPIPESGVTDIYVTDPSEAIGKSLKIQMRPGTPITQDVLMDDARPDDITYERDLTFNYLPIALDVDDYIDINMTLPYGEVYKVIQHAKVKQISDNVVKTIFTESEMARWESAMKDYALYNGLGLTLWCAKYEEPGLDQDAVPFYPVRLDAESIVTLNPNITNKAECVNTEIRKDIDARLALVDEESGRLSSTGASNEASSINAAVAKYKAALMQSEAASATDTTSMDEPMDSENDGVTAQDIVDSAGSSLSNNPDDIQ